MLVIVASEHIRRFSEITPSGWVNLGDIITWANQEFDLPGGMLFARFGDMNLNAGTVPHLHWNLWVPDRTGEVRIPVFKTPDKQEVNRRQALEYGLRYDAGEVPG